MGRGESEKVRKRIPGSLGTHEIFEKLGNCTKVAKRTPSSAGIKYLSFFQLYAADEGVRLATLSEILNNSKNSLMSELFTLNFRITSPPPPSVSDVQVLSRVPT